ncbi:TetR/AcrR family transcriptional regulator [Geodermatophilus sp. SYSU D00766]
MTSTGPDGRRRRARRGQGGELREHIVDTAATLLAESGDEQAVSIRAVADAVGVTPPSLYLHFPDKTALLRAVVERLFADLEQDVARSQAGSGGPVERVLALARAYVDFGLGSPGRYKVLYEGRVLPALDLPDGGVPGRALIEAAAGDLQEAVQSGHHLPAGGARATAVLLWQLLHGAVSLRINKPGFPWQDAWSDVEPAVRALVGVRDQG